VLYNTNITEGSDIIQCDACCGWVLSNKNIDIKFSAHDAFLE